MTKEKGKIIVFEGPDGSGKSTQYKRFGESLTREGYKTFEIREPGGTQIGEQIRRVLLDPSNKDMTLKTEVLLFMAARAQLLEERVRPAVERGEFVLFDRFYFSTLAYQGNAGEMPIEQILTIKNIVVPRDLEPDWVVLLDVSPEAAERRLSPLLKADRIESRSLEYRRAVRNGYLQQARANPNLFSIFNTDNTDIVETERNILTEYHRRFPLPKP